MDLVVTCGSHPNFHVHFCCAFLQLCIRAKSCLCICACVYVCACLSAVPPWGHIRNSTGIYVMVFYSDIQVDPIFSERRHDRLRLPDYLHIFWNWLHIPCTSRIRILRILGCDIYLSIHLFISKSRNGKIYKKCDYEQQKHLSQNYDIDYCCTLRNLYS